MATANILGLWRRLSLALFHVGMIYRPCIFSHFKACCCILHACNILPFKRNGQATCWKGLDEKLMRKYVINSRCWFWKKAQILLNLNWVEFMSTYHFKKNWVLIFLLIYVMHFSCDAIKLKTLIFVFTNDGTLN